MTTKKTLAEFFVDLIKIELTADKTEKELEKTADALNYVICLALENDDITPKETIALTTLIDYTLIILHK